MKLIQNNPLLIKQKTISQNLGTRAFITYFSICNLPKNGFRKKVSGRAEPHNFLIELWSTLKWEDEWQEKPLKYIFVQSLKLEKFMLKIEDCFFIISFFNRAVNKSFFWGFQFTFLLSRWGKIRYLNF